MIKANNFGIIVNEERLVEQSLLNSATSDEYPLDEAKADGFDTNSTCQLTDSIAEIDEEPTISYEARSCLSCFAHSLQLVIRDGLDNVGHISKASGKCTDLSRKSHKSIKDSVVQTQPNGVPRIYRCDRSLALGRKILMISLPPSATNISN